MLLAQAKKATAGFNGWTAMFLVCLASAHLASLTSAAKERGKKCIITRSYKMLSADCHGLDLTSIPGDIQTEIEVMDATFNRIRELQCGAFDNYSSLKLLYLGDNLITTIEEGTFMNLVYLEVLDLSLNALKTIPLELVNLKFLRKIYMDKNYIDSTSLAQLDALPDTFSISSLSLAHCKLKKLPPLQKFPNLMTLNASENELEAINPKDLAPACDLMEIDLNNNKPAFSQTGCECQMLKQYFTEKSIKLVPPFMLNCTHRTQEDFGGCSNSSTMRETEEIYSSCVNHKLMLKEASLKKTWWITGVLIAGLIVALAVGAWWCYKRTMTKHRKNNLSHPPMRVHGDGATDDLTGEARPLQDSGFNVSSFS